ncbi:MAG: 3-deoxy-7-phosphoheptulonate synthase [Lentisphaerae bacterium]|nr:3-deoxy-7-phosphoheptulonate synthase [Lentisphaerota bacterium]
MVIILKENPDPNQLENLLSWIKEQHVTPHITHGLHQTILGLVGDTAKIDIELLGQMEIVEAVRRVQEPFKNANRKFHPLDTIINVNGSKIGGNSMTVIAGPCSVESEEQIITVARSVKESGAKLLRGGAFKPRTSPYAFQGLRDEGIRLLLEAKKDTGLPIVTEIMDLSQLELFADVDVIQVGARNMQNFELLKQLGHSDKPILLKRGLANTYQELLMSAEYIMAFGNDNVILCERGVRTFETYTRNTQDISAIPALKTLSHLPVIIDPSHAAGVARFVPPLSLAAVAAGADGLIIEVHNNPACAKCDGMQSLTMPEFRILMKKIKVMTDARELCSSITE